MLKLELKRILKTRLTWWISAIAFAVCILLAVLVISFTRYTDADMLSNNSGAGYVRGLDAIEAHQQRYALIEGEVSPIRIGKAYEVYRQVINEYGDDYPPDVYYEKIAPFKGILSTTRQVFYEPSGLSKDIQNISPDEASTFYSQRKKYIHTMLSSKYSEHPEVADYALSLDESVNEPFKYYYGVGDSDAAEYMTICTLILAIICVMIAAPTFSAEYASGSDDILRCTKKGKSRLALTKVCAALIISTGLYILCAGVFISITVSSFGLDSSSVQFNKSTMIFASLTENSFLLLIFISGLLAILAICSLSLFLSSNLNSPMLSLALSIGIVLLPTIINIAGSGSNIENWIRLCLPSGGVGFGTNMFYELISGNFLWAGKFVIWSPRMMLAVAIVELPLLSGFSIISYNKHKLA